MKLQCHWPLIVKQVKSRATCSKVNLFALRTARSKVHWLFLGILCLRCITMTVLSVRPLQTIIVNYTTSRQFMVIEILNWIFTSSSPRRLRSFASPDSLQHKDMFWLKFKPSYYFSTHFVILWPRLATYWNISQ